MIKAPAFLCRARYHGLDARPLALRESVLGMLLAVAMLIFAFGCGPCEDQQRAVERECKADPQSQACDDAVAALKACILPSPTPSPSPTVEPTPSPTPTPPEPTPTPGPTPTPVGPAPLIPDEQLEAQEPQDGKRLTWASTDAAVRRWRAAHPEAWISYACLSAGPAGIDAAFQATADELLAVGIVAGQSITAWGQRSDAVFVNRPGTALYEETHLFDYARGCVATTPNAVKGVWQRSVPSPPACPAPRWESYAAQPGDCGFVWGLTVGHKWIDATLNVRRCCGFCAAIGLGTMPDGHTIRCQCPLRPEGNPEREPCEAEVGAVWQVRGGTLWPNPDNPAQANCEGAGCQVRVCTKSGVCSEWTP